MPDPVRATYFDTPGRTERDVREAQIVRLQGAPMLSPLLDAVGAPAAFVNSDREILLCNQLFAGMVGVPADHVVGRRFGEAVGCIHAFEPPAGCGTTEACAWCGGGQALRTARIANEQAVVPCRVSTIDADHPGTIDAEVTCTPLVVAEIEGVVIVVRDMQAQHQREVLERIFFHDVLNAAGGLRGLLQTWADIPAAEAAALAPTAARLATHLVEEIEAHRDLVDAERGALIVRTSPVHPHDVVEELRALYLAHEVASGRCIDVRVDRTAPAFDTDPVLLRRVLGNLVKNALEATPPGGIVRVSYTFDEGGRRFSVHNRTAMTDATQRLVFQRSFTTKGRGRGFGTYGAKLIAEQYLGAAVTFESRILFGTTFTVAWPQAATRAA